MMALYPSPESLARMASASLCWAKGPTCTWKSLLSACVTTKTGYSFLRSAFTKASASSCLLTAATWTMMPVSDCGELVSSGVVFLTAAFLSSDLEASGSFAAASADDGVAVMAADSEPVAGAQFASPALQGAVEADGPWRCP